MWALICCSLQVALVFPTHTRTYWAAAWDFIPDFCSFPDTLRYDIVPLPASHPAKQEVRKLGVTES